MGEDNKRGVGCPKLSPTPASNFQCNKPMPHAINSSFSFVCQSITPFLILFPMHTHVLPTKTPHSFYSTCVAYKDSTCLPKVVTFSFHVTPLAPHVGELQNPTYISSFTLSHTPTHHQYSEKQQGKRERAPSMVMEF